MKTFSPQWLAKLRNGEFFSQEEWVSEGDAARFLQQQDVEILTILDIPDPVEISVPVGARICLFNRCSITLSSGEPQKEMWKFYGYRTLLNDSFFAAINTKTGKVVLHTNDKTKPPHK